jgi:hypothetical protein
MGASAGFNWSEYIHTLDEHAAVDLATWIAITGLEAGEFMEVVDRAYAVAPAHWQCQPEAFLLGIGRPAAEAYARRKREFARLLVLVEAARISGALPGDVAPQELQASALL